MENIKTKVNKLDNNLVEIEVEIAADKASEAYDKILKRFSSNLNIAGFRKGKIPKAMVEKHIGLENIKGETLNYLCNDNMPEIITSNNLDLAIAPTVKKFEYNKGEAFKFTLEAELKPEFTLASYKGGKYEFEEYKIDENFVADELKTIQERFSTKENVEGRATKEDDIVVFDFEGLLDGVPFEHGKAEKYELDLAHSNFIPGFAEGLVGHNIGEEFLIDVKFPEDYHAENLKGKDTQFKILIHEIKERKLPELDDKLAAKAGQFKTLDELKDSISKYINDYKAAEDEKRKTEVVFKEILDKTEINIQDAMIQRECEVVRDEVLQRAAQQGMGADKVIEAEGGKEKFDESIKEEAIRRIKNTLVIEKISKEENIQVEQGDIIKEMGEIARMYGEQSRYIFEEIKKNPNSFSVISQQAASKKVGKFLADNNEFTVK